jgi:hypothetical protein
MQEIAIKINELLALNAVEPNYGVPDADPTSFTARMDKQEALMQECIALARSKGTLFGRIIRIPMADSSAVYVITKLNTRTVQLTWVKFCDNWVDQRIGYQGTYPLALAQKQADFDDYWEKLVADRKAEREGATK